MADRTIVIPEVDSDVAAVVATARIKVNIVVEHEGGSRLEVNEQGNFVAHIEGNVYTITTAIFRQFTFQRLLGVCGSVMTVAYGLHRLGYVAGPFFPGSIGFVVYTEPVKERAVRRRLENGTFLQELKEEVSDIIQQHSDILGDLKRFNIISCKEIQKTQEKGGSFKVKDVKMEDAAFMAHNVNIGPGAVAAGQASGSQGKSSSFDMPTNVEIGNVKMENATFAAFNINIDKQNK
ncbi:uncharacterized protein LOC100183163 [Ciona intestinalis]